MRVKFISWFVAAGGAFALTLLFAGIMSGRAPAPLAAASADGAREAVVSVNGMVCSICARHLESRLRKISAVNDVTVNLEKQTAALRLKPDAELTEDQISDAVRDAGFNVTAIEWRGEPKVASGTAATAEFKVDGMDCSRCAANLARVLEKQPGVVAARVDFDKKRAVITYDGKKTTVGQIEKTIEDSGVFRAELVSRPVPKDKK